MSRIDKSMSGIEKALMANAHALASLGALQNEVRLISTGVENLKVSTPDIVQLQTEIEDKMRRANNLILFYIDEQRDCSISQALQRDGDAALSVLVAVVPDLDAETVKTRRLGKFAGDKTRPVTLSSGSTAQEVLRNRGNYRGNIVIREYRTPAEQEKYREAKKRADDFNAGNPEIRKRVVYRNGTPVVVDIRSTAKN